MTRVLPDGATNASRDLFFADPAVTDSGATVLLRPAQQGTGTAVNRPSLYVLDPNYFQEDEWIRIGDGSRAEYRQIANVDNAVRHVSLDLPLRNAHAIGTSVRALAVAAAGAPFADPTFQLVDDTAPGATEILIDSGADAILVAALPAGTASADWLVVEIGTAPAAEYVYAREAASPAVGQVRLTLAQPLRYAHGATATVTILDATGGTSDTLDLPANSGDLIVYPTIQPLPAAFSNIANIILFEPGSDRQEAHGIGELATLPLLLPAYTAYPAGTAGRLVTLTDDDRTIQGALTDGPTLTLNSVAGLSIGMTLRFDVGTGEDGIVDAIDTVANTITLRAALNAVPATADVEVPAKTLAADAAPGALSITLRDRLGLTAGAVIRIGADEVAIVREVVGERGAPPDAGAILLEQPLRQAHSVATTQVRRVEVAPEAGGTRNITGALSAGPVLTLNSVAGLSVGMILTFDIGTGEVGIIDSINTATNAITLNAVLSAVPTTALVLVPPKQRVSLVLGAPTEAEAIRVNDGSAYVAGEVVEFTLPDGTEVYHRLAGNAAAAAPGAIELNVALTYGHDAGQPVLERQRLLEVRALDAGAWGNRLMVGCRDEAQGLVSDVQLQAVNPPPAAGMFSSLQLSSLTGVEPGTILEVLDPNGVALNMPFLKVRGVDRASRLALLDQPGLQPEHMTAYNNARSNGHNLRVRSREFNLVVMLRQRPDPAVPTRNDTLLDQELFRHLSMDPRHSRYVMRIIGATWAPDSVIDDLGVPLRRWDHRSEGSSAYVRINDLAASGNREAIRLGPEALVDVMPSGLTRIARHPLGERAFVVGDDAVALMNDALYAGADYNEPSRRTGLYTLKNVQNVSLVAIPGQTGAALQQALIDHCEEMRYRFAVLDGPAPDNDTLTDVQIHRQQYDTKYAALYHPWLMIPDPFPSSLAILRQYPIPPSGHILGIYARVDNERGVHKAPANEVVRGITSLTRYFTKGEQDILNPYPQNINVIRDFRANNRAIRVWGARCITSDNDYKYVNVRRLLIFLEDSIDRGLQWVVFEPNAEELWARVRRSVTNFLTTVWRNGALEGTTPAEGFFVKCDRTTMTRDDIDNGRLICVIGVAPVKPAEFVIIRIGLWTADAET